MNKYKLMSLFTILILACVCLTNCSAKRYGKDSFPGWTWIGGHDDGLSLYVDEKSIKHLNGNTLSWFTMTMTSGDYIRYYLEIDCSNDKYRGLFATRYDEKGDVKENIPEKQDWSYASNGTAYYVMIKEVCK